MRGRAGCARGRGGREGSRPGRSHGGLHLRRPRLLGAGAGSGPCSPGAGVDVKAETCPQYLYLDVSRLEGPDAIDFVCTPPLRDPWHAEELWEGLATGYVHTVATDHCPFWRADRRAGIAGRPGGVSDFTDIPGGLPGIETRLALVWQGVRAGRISAADWVRLCAEAPARTFGLWPAKGSLAVGADADVVVWDPQRHQSLSVGSLDMAVDQSPYEGTVGRMARTGSEPGPTGRGRRPLHREIWPGAATRPEGSRSSARAVVRRCESPFAPPARWSGRAGRSEAGPCGGSGWIPWARSACRVSSRALRRREKVASLAPTWTLRHLKFAR